MAIDRNKARIIGLAHQHVVNYAMSNQFAKALETNNKLNGILRLWAKQEVKANLFEKKHKKVK